VGELFAGFFSVGIVGFGGVLPLTRRMIVERRRWMTPAEFTDLLALCQFLPGGNVINLSAATGLRFRGLPGALMALAGLMAAPMAIIILLGLVYARFQDSPAVRRLFAGLAAAAAGLVIAMAVKIAAPMRHNLAGVAVAAACFAALALLRMPLLTTMAVMVPTSVFIAWRRDVGRRDAGRGA
jgi:chromate transporter